MTTIPDEAIEAAGERLETLYPETAIPYIHVRAVPKAAAGTLERQAIQEFIETSGFYLARELSEAACYRQSLGTPCGKQHPHIEVVYGVPEEIVAEYLTRKGASDE